MKLTKLALVIGLAGSSLAMVSSPAQAFQIFFDQLTTSGNSYNYDFHIQLQNGDVITEDLTNVSFLFAGSPTSRPNITGRNAPESYIDENGDSQSYFRGQDPATNGPNGGTDAITGKRTKLQSFIARTSASYVDPSTVGYTAADNVYRFTVNLTSNARVTTLCVDANCAYTPDGFDPSPNAVPEASSALVPVLALGFGYLYSKRRKNLQLVGNKDQ